MSQDLGIGAVIELIGTVYEAGKGVYEASKNVIEMSRFSSVNKALVREFNTLWKRKGYLEEALFAYNRMEDRIWVPSSNALNTKKLTAATIMRRTRKQLEAEGIKGPFNTGLPSGRFKVESVKKDLVFLFSSESRNKKDRETLEELRQHNKTLAASIVAWGHLEMLYCKNLAAADPGAKKPSAVAIKMRMRKIARDGHLIMGRLLTGKRAMSLANAPSRVVD